MSIATRTARDTVEATTGITASDLTGRGRDRNVKSVLFLVALWFSLFFGVVVLIALIVDTVIKGAPRLDAELFTNYHSKISPDTTGFRAGILGSIWLMFATALLAIPLGMAAAIYLEEFANKRSRLHRVIDVNLQNLAAVPSVIYGMLAVAVLALFDPPFKGIVIGGALALALLILPVIIITTREAIRAVPQEIRQGSLALGATVWQTTWRNTLPSAVPGIATGTILGLSRAIGEAAPLLMLGVAMVRTDPTGLFDKVTALPIQIYNFSSEPNEAYQIASSAAIVILLAMILGMNALAIVIRNKFQKSW
ncbi:phosphate ABC transporter permease PstA [Nocardioides yefusunii]|uniref:Phosphate transport system permease protein PstA n=1 Tax=Nocardioides yefusunii TaxID=2500546 RepID=A0ABW1QTY6_9ACTN|nr:phosphate ABC transporter permease PstA [Nocardioides yefusunii]